MRGFFDFLDGNRPNFVGIINRRRGSKNVLTVNVQTLLIVQLLIWRLQFVVKRKV